MAMPLTMLKPGKKARILSIRGGRGAQARLASMGLIPGTVIEVVRSSYSGPFVIAVREGRMIIGHGMAQKIFIE